MNSDRTSNADSFRSTRDDIIPAPFAILVQQMPTARCGECFIQRVLPPIEVHVATTDEQQDQVAANECGEDAEVSPSFVEADAKRLVEFVSDPVCAIRTV